MIIYRRLILNRLIRDKVAHFQYLFVIILLVVLKQLENHKFSFLKGSKIFNTDILLYDTVNWKIAFMTVFLLTVNDSLQIESKGQKVIDK